MSHGRVPAGSRERAGTSWAVPGESVAPGDRHPFVPLGSISLVRPTLCSMPVASHRLGGCLWPSVTTRDYHRSQEADVRTQRAGRPPAQAAWHQSYRPARSLRSLPSHRTDVSCPAEATLKRLWVLPYAFALCPPPALFGSAFWIP